MKTRLLRIIQVPLLVAITVLFAGCQKKDDTTAPPAAGMAAAASSHAAGAIQSAEKNSFDQVTAKLDAGGSFYLYLSTEQFLSGLAQKIGSFSNMIAGSPTTSAADRQNIGRAFQVVNDLIVGSGVQHVSGVGISSIALGPDLYRNKVVIHHYENESDGLMWNVFGKTPHPLKELDLMPENTVAAIYGDLDVPLLWKSLEQELSSLHVPEVDKAMAELPEKFKAVAGLSLDEAVNSLGSGYGAIFTLDESDHIVIPIPKMTLEIPAPGLAIYVKVKDDTLYSRIEQLTANIPGGTKSDEGGVKAITFAIPFLSLFRVQPTVARSGDYLFVTSSDKMLHEMLDVQAGKKKGFKSSEEFKKLAEGVPLEGNSYSLVTARFGQTLQGTMQKAMSALQPGAAVEPNKMMQNMMALNPPGFAFAVGANGPEGWETVANGNQSMGTAVMILPAVAAVGLLSAIAIPNFVRARTTSQENACINNLRLIDAAKAQWALEKNKKNSDTPTEADLQPYLGQGASGEFPKCPADGTYIIGSVGEKPRCTVPGHVLP